MLTKEEEQRFNQLLNTSQGTPVVLGEFRRLKRKKYAHISKYIKDKGVHCLYCESSELVVGSFEVDGGEVLQRVVCTACKKCWHDIYTLTSVYELE